MSEKSLKRKLDRRRRERDDKEEESVAVKIRKIVGLVFFIAVLILTINLCIVMIHRINTVALKDDYERVFIRELFLMAFLLVGSLDLWLGFFTAFKNKALKVIGWILRVLVLAGCVCILFISSRVIAGGMKHSAENADCVIVLGMALEDGKPTRDLIYRLEEAIDYKEKNPKAILILTGGNPDENGKTEAKVMCDFLKENGIKDDSIFLEDKASTTRENFKNSAEMIHENAKVAIITNNYHMNRAVRIAEEANFRNVVRLPAHADWKTYIASLMWEVVMEINNIIS